MDSSTPRATRRRFLQAATVGAGLGIVSHADGAESSTAGRHVPDRSSRLPREVWVASIAQEKMRATRYQQMIKDVLGRMESVVPFQPDIVCLPEIFPFVNLNGSQPPLKEVAEVPIGDISGPFAEFAKRNRCYVVCPVYTKEDGRFYNAAVFIGRDGQLVGEYRKMHPTIGEMEQGVSPGPLDPPVFETDFGKVGAQICFDIEWYDGWERLRQKGAEIVFWPSAFGGGKMVNTKAWQNHYCVVSSTNKGTTKVCDVNGEAIAKTGQFAGFVCAPLNLEKAFLHTWPFCRRFPEIQSKYGRKIHIQTFHEEEWSIIESRSPDVKIADVMKEFDLKTRDEHIAEADEIQRQRRRS